MSKKTLTSDELYEQAQDLIEEARDRDALYDRLDALYDQAKGEEDDTPGAESRVQRVTMPYASSIVDLVADLAAQMELSLTVPAAKESQAAKQDADAVEKWLLAWFESNQTRQHKNYSADLAFLGAQRGACVLRTLFVDSALERVNGERSIKRMPIVLQARDPRTVYWQDGLDGLDVVVESWERPLREIRVLYPDVLPDLAGRDKVEWTEVWTKDIRCYFANGEAVKVRGKAVIPHGLGCNPYVVGMRAYAARGLGERAVSATAAARWRTPWRTWICGSPCWRRQAGRVRRADGMSSPTTTARGEEDRPTAGCGQLLRSE